MAVPKLTLSEVLRDRWWIGAAAFAVALVATPVARAVAYRFRIVDRPDDLLKPHGRPVAYMGGLAICLGLLVGLAAYVAVMPNRDEHLEHVRTVLFSLRVWELLEKHNPLWKVLAIAVASIVITGVGLADDLVDLRPRQKVYGQIAAAAILVVGGIGHRMATVVFDPLGWAPPAWVVVPVSAVMCVVAVVAACNATNLLDGLDGLCGGVTGIIALGYLALGVWLAIWVRYPNTEGVRIALCLAMAGAVFGFLPYNIPPASIFMGDAGSMLLGFFAATMMALFCREGNARWFLAACAIFALPIVDTALAVVRRALGRRSIFAGDRSHLYDQLVDRGMSVKQVVALFYALALLAAALGVVLAMWVQGRYAMILYAVLAAASGIAFWRLGMIRPPPRRRADSPDSDAA